MAKQKVKVGQEVKNKCPVCGGKNICLPCEIQDQLPTFKHLREVNRIGIWCDKCDCDTEFWFYPRTGKITVKGIDKPYVD